jgi:hypothetical protein
MRRRDPFADDEDVHPDPVYMHERSHGYRYYLEDHPFLVPIITIILGGLCIYSTIFSTLLRDTLLGSGADRSTLDSFYTVTGWGVAFVFALTALATIFLVLQLVDLGFKRVRRRPAICPECGLPEVKNALQFTRRRIEDTDLESLICPRCGHTWYNRR